MKLMTEVAKEIEMRSKDRLNLLKKEVGESYSECMINIARIKSIRLLYLKYMKNLRILKTSIYITTFCSSFIAIQIANNTINTNIIFFILNMGLLAISFYIALIINGFEDNFTKNIGLDANSFSIISLEKMLSSIKNKEISTILCHQTTSLALSEIKLLKNTGLIIDTNQIESLVQDINKEIEEKTKINGYQNEILDFWKDYVSLSIAEEQMTKENIT